ncbi:MAG: zinc ribbon domain-containing protein [Clostridia bacterium]|nr:zinc ribbon domain-containing protein [Clostridia bacterium]
MFCNKCGANLPNDAAFCPSCGAAAAPDEAPSDPYRVTPTATPYAKTVDPREREASKSVLTFGIIALAFSCTGIFSFVGFIFAFITRSKVKAYESEFGPATGKAQIGKIFYIVSIPLSIVVTIIAIYTIIARAVALSYYQRIMNGLLDDLNSYMN